MAPKNDPELATLRKELEELYNTLKVNGILLLFLDLFRLEFYEELKNCFSPI